MDVAALRHASGVWSQPFPRVDSPQTLVLAFASPSYRDRPEVLADLAAAFPNSVVMGCSTAGEIHQAKIVDDSVTVAVTRFERTRLRTAHAALGSASDSFAAGAAIADRLRADDLRAIFVLSEGMRVNGSELVRGINSNLAENVVVTGGLAGDGDRFAQTWVLRGGAAETNVVVAVGMYGDSVRVTHGSQGGWDAFGPERVVTGSAGNVLQTLDGRPALSLYKEYLGDRAGGLPSSALLFPLAVRESQGAHSVVRTILAVDEATQSMTFAGDIPIGHKAKLMRANVDRLILGAESAAKATTGAHDGSILSIAISCVGRRLVLGLRTDEETEAALDALPPGTTQVGFYSYGELSPHPDGRCDLHNQTMTLTVVSEGG